VLPASPFSFGKNHQKKKPKEEAKEMRLLLKKQKPHNRIYISLRKLFIYKE